ncbi:uL22 family ribosomal protein [Candidatus Vidania fulgoroideorum]
MKEKLINSNLKNVNCSFKKLKKVINLLKYNDLSSIILILFQNRNKTFFFLKKVFINCINNALNFGYSLNKINLKFLYVTKGKTTKKIFPRAKGKCDFLKVSRNNIFLSLKYNG